MATAAAVAAKAPDRSTRAAEMMRESGSRQYRSVPSQCCHDTDCSAEPASVASGGYGATSGANSAISAMAMITQSAVNDSGLRRARGQTRDGGTLTGVAVGA